MNKIMSIDAETDGLWGNPFAIGGVVYDEQGQEVDKIAIRISDATVKNEWVKENVLPALASMPITHSSYERMLKSFADWYLTYSEKCTILYHMGHIVESHLFREMHRLGFIGDWDAPYFPIDVADHLFMAGERPESVDEYKHKYGIQVADYGSTHNPLYDCEVSYRVYADLQNKNRRG